MLNPSAGGTIKRYFKGLMQYYTDAKDEIAATNLISLKYCCFVGIIFCICFSLLAAHAIQSWTVTREYLLAFAVFVIFYFVYLLLHRAKTLNAGAVEVACAAFYAASLAALIGISVFPYPATPQYFLTAFYIFMPVMLLQRPVISFLIMLCSEAVFLVLAYQYKTPECVEQDLFNTVASMAFSLVVLITVNRLRVSDFNVRKKLQEMSKIDGLTGLLNKSAFDENGRLAIENDQRLEHIALLVIDVDDFKAINDQFGHPAGDGLLAGIGDTLKEIFRAYDLVGRFGGDEFCVLMQGVTQRDAVEQKILQVQHRVETLKFEGTPICATCSVGAVFPVSGSITYEEAFRAADDNLYAAKNNGKNCYCISFVEGRT